MPRIQYEDGEKPLYTVKKLGALYQVLDSRGILQFQSLKRINATEWLKNNSPTKADNGS